MQLVTLPKLAARSAWPESRVRRMVARGLLPHIRINGRLLLPETAIEDYVANHFVAAADRPTSIGTAHPDRSGARSCS